MKSSFKIYLSFVFLVITIGPSYSQGLQPDNIKSHCEAFDGEWVDEKCKNRLEYQQTPVRSKLGTFSALEWCKARGGNLKQTSRGMRCLNKASSQGIRRYRSIEKESQRNKKIAALNYCLGKDFEKTECRIKSSDEFNYKQGKLSRHVGGKLWDTIRLVNYGFEQINSSFNSRNKYFDPCSKFETNPLTYIENSLADYTEKKELKACQTACLVRCITSNYITYDSKSKSATIQTPYQTARHGRGICGDFSNFSRHLLEFLGYDSQTEYGVFTSSGKIEPHNWTSLTIDGEKYWFEPQQSACIFYKDF